MSAADAEVVRGLYDAFNRRDVDAWIASFAPHATWHEIPSGEVFDVPDGVRAYYERFATAFPDGEKATRSPIPKRPSRVRVGFPVFTSQRSMAPSPNDTASRLPSREKAASADR